MLDRSVISSLQDFKKQGQGMLLFYSLKNSTYPEYVFHTDCGVMCLDIHEHLSYLMAVGFDDGSVAVYNLKEDRPQPVYKSTSNSNPVWKVELNCRMEINELKYDVFYCHLRHNVLNPDWSEALIAVRVIDTVIHYCFHSYRQHRPLWQTWWSKRNNVHI